MGDQTNEAGLRPLRRKLLAALACTPFAAAATASVRLALEADLTDAVRASLSAEVEGEAPPRPSFDSPAAQSAYEAWHGFCSAKLRVRLPEDDARTEFLDTVWYESRRAGLETSLLMGLIHVESGFRRYAISPVGARGYMQIMPFWAQLLGAADASKLFHVQTNLRFGCSILRHYLDREQGRLSYALGRYNGQREGATYPSLVFDRRSQWSTQHDRSIQP
jgi:soluble lytic murein transglycosylase-like protein